MAEINAILTQKIEALNRKKSELEAEHTVLTRQLSELDEEIKKQGYDPEKLPEKAAELSKLISEFEAKATPIVDKIASGLQGVENEEHIVQSFGGFEPEVKPAANPTPPQNTGGDFSFE